MRRNSDDDGKEKKRKGKGECHCIGAEKKKRKKNDETRRVRFSSGQVSYLCSSVAGTSHKEKKYPVLFTLDV